MKATILTRTGASLFIALAVRFLSAAELNVPTEYSTITGAVSAAKSGDTIRVAKGDYYEQFVIVNRTNLTVQGEPGTILHGSDGMEQTLLPYDGSAFTIAGVVRGSDVTFRGLKFHGHRLADNYATALTGIVFRGSSGRVEDCEFEGFRGEGAQESRAINFENHLSDNARAQTIAILNNTFIDNKTAVILWGAKDNPGSVRTMFTLEGNTIRSADGVETLSYGVALRIGVQGAVRRNTIVGHTSIGVVANDSLFVERGSFYPLRRLEFSENIFSNNAVHLVGIAAHNAIVTNNVFERKAEDARPWGVTLTGTNLVVADNNFSDMAQGVSLPANELLEGVSRGAVRDIELRDNWFVNVTTPVVASASAREIDEVGTEKSNFAPRLQTFSPGPEGKIRVRARSWHNQIIDVELSNDLKQWVRSRQITVSMPTSIFEESIDAFGGSEFFRLAAPVRGE